MEGLYERIVIETERMGLNGKELGIMLGLKKSPLTDWKNQKSNPTLEQLYKLCEIFAVSADYLLFNCNNNLLSPDQNELINTYDKLDRRGQHRVHTIIYEELDRMKKEATTPRNVV